MDDFDKHVVILNYPGDDIEKVENLVRDSDFFTTTNLTERSNLYRIMSHHDPRNEVRFQAIFDRNIYSDLTTLATHRQPKSIRSDHCLKTSAALLAFLQIADISIDYGACLYEYADTHSGDDAIDEFRAFEQIDNSDPSHLIDFALGRVDSLFDLVEPRSSKPLPIDGDEFEKKLWKFRISFTCALKIADLHSSEMTGEDKMLGLLDWMHDDFMFSSAALLFANRLFCPNSISKMLKGIDRSSIRNAAWDICLVQDWRSRTLNQTTDGAALLLCTRDRAVNDMARSMMGDSDSDVRANFVESWGRRTGVGKRIFARYQEYTSRITESERRQITTEEQFQILKELERKLGF